MTLNWNIMLYYISAYVSMGILVVQTDQSPFCVCIVHCTFVCPRLSFSCRPVYSLMFCAFFANLLDDPTIVYITAACSMACLHFSMTPWACPSSQLKFECLLSIQLSWATFLTIIIIHKQLQLWYTCNQMYFTKAYYLDRMLSHVCVCIKAFIHLVLIFYWYKCFFRFLHKF